MTKEKLALRIFNSHFHKKNMAATNGGQSNGTHSFTEELGSNLQFQPQKELIYNLQLLGPEV